MTESNLKPVTSLPREISDAIKRGSVLAGNELTGDGLATWFAQEQEAFFEDDAGNSKVSPWYAYMRYLNELMGFSKIHAIGATGSLLVLGPGSGIEVERFAVGRPGWTINFLEASENFKGELRRKFPKARIIDPVTSGDIHLRDESQDAVCALSVLHHIPNVGHVLGEIARVIKPGGYLIVREPCSSMGDWRYPRSATPNERGISRQWITSRARELGFEMASRPVPILFQPLNSVLNRINLPFGLLYVIDRLLSAAVSPNDYYWRDAWYKKIGPSSYFYVFRRAALR